jgi:hypothetical protein
MIKHYILAYGVIALCSLNGHIQASERRPTLHAHPTYSTQITGMANLVFLQEQTNIQALGAAPFHSRVNIFKSLKCLQMFNERANELPQLAEFFHVIVSDCGLYREFQRGSQFKSYQDGLMQLMQNCAAVAIKRSQQKKSPDLPELVDRTVKVFDTLYGQAREFLCAQSERVKNSLSQAYEAFGTAQQVVILKAEARQAAQQAKQLHDANPAKKGNTKNNMVWQKRLAAYAEKGRTLEIAIVAAEQEFARAQVIENQALGHLKLSLNSFREAAFFLCFNQGLKELNLARISGPLLYGIFKLIETNEHILGLVEKAHAAFMTELPKSANQEDCDRHEKIQKSYLMTLQNYVLEHEDPAKSKGYLWEIAVGIYIHDRSPSFGILISFNDHVNLTPTYSREFDVVTAYMLIECKNCNWERRDLHQQAQQKSISAEKRKQFVVISKTPITLAKQQMLAELGVAFVDCNNQIHQELGDFSGLYKLPYFTDNPEK